MQFGVAVIKKRRCHIGLAIEDGESELVQLQHKSLQPEKIPGQNNWVREADVKAQGLCFLYN